MELLTFKDERSGTVTICVDMYMSSYGTMTIEYRVSDILVVPHGKRKAVSIRSLVRDNYEFRHRDHGEREAFIRQEYLKYCTEDQIAQAVQNAYKTLAPNEDNLKFTCL